MRILITGGAGFLGLHLAKYFSKKNFDVYLLDIASFDKSEYPKDCKFIILNINNRKSISELFKKNKFDFVVHAAAALPLQNKEEIFKVNIDGTKNILDASISNKVKRLFYISSTAVYGIPKRHPIRESDPRIGVGPYGESKIAAENLCFEYMKKGIDVTIIRPKTFLGTYRLGVFEILFDWIHDGKKIPLIGNGDNRYQLLDVEDLVTAIYLFVIRDNPKFNDAFNIGSEKFYSIKKDFNIFFKTIKSKSKTLSTPAILVKKILWIFEKLKLSPLYKWVYETADKDSFVSIKHLTDILDWHPKYSNSDALIKAYRWYFKNYKEIKSRGSGLTHTVGWKQGILGIIKKLM